MKCPDCETELTCLVSLHSELADRPIEINYQWWRCKGCEKKFFAKLEDSHVNMFDDRLEHQGCYASEEVWQSTLAVALTCPDPGNAACKCAVHQYLPPPGFHGLSAWYSFD